MAKEEDVNLAMADLLAQVGLTKRRRAERLADMINCSDLSVVGRGLELSYKLDKSMSEQINVGITPDDIRALIASLPIPDTPEVIDITPG